MKNIIVSGGGGFVGKAIVRAALAEGAQVRVIGRHYYTDVEEFGAQCLVGDICDRNFLFGALRDADVVFHVAALAGIWGRWQDYYAINYQGTANVVAACRQNNISSLVYTSTPSVVFNGEDIKGGDETLPYAEKFLCHYAKSKAMAEQLVLQSNDSELATCALRPHLVWGPGDPHLVPRLLERGRLGQLKQVGAGTNLVDISYVDNVAHAHILAAKNLQGDRDAAGKAYFIGQENPVNLWKWINDLFGRVGIAPVEKKVPFKLAYAAGAVLEVAHWTLFPRREPQMTRFLAEQLSRSHYFSHENIKNDLGYAPVVTTELGMQFLVDWIKRHEI